MSQQRMGSFTKGMKAGAIKGALDKAVSPITTPVAEAISAKLAEINPGLQLTAPMVETLMKSIIIMGLAELVDVASPAMKGHLPLENSKLEAVPEFMREYAGEKFGNEIVELAMKMAPMIMGAFSQFSAEEIRQATPNLEEGTNPGEQKASNDEDELFPKRLLEDEDDEVEEAIAVPAFAAPAHKVSRISRKIAC